MFGIQRLNFFPGYHQSPIKHDYSQLIKNGFSEQLKHAPLAPFVYIKLNEKNNPKNKIYEKIIHEDFPFNYCIADDMILVSRPNINSTETEMDHSIVKLEKYGIELEIYKTRNLLHLFGYWKNHEFIIKFLGTNKKQIEELIEELIKHNNNNYDPALIKSQMDDALQKYMTEIVTLRRLAKQNEQTINKYATELNHLRQDIENDRWDNWMTVFIIIFILSIMIILYLVPAPYKKKKDY
jgi:hypothetical protein